MRYVVDWMNKKGAYCSKSVEPDELPRVLSSLRAEATVWFQGEVVGAVVRDGRRWQWWYEDQDELSVNSHRQSS